MLASIALLVLGSFVVISMMVSSATSRDASRERGELSANEQLARDAATSYANAYSALAAGEHTSFAIDQAAMRDLLSGRSASANGRPDQVIPNGRLRGQLGSLRSVDEDTIPASGRFSVRTVMADGRTGYWQPFAMRVPTWGDTKGGVVTVYIRSWSANGNRLVGQPLVTKVRLRPTWFSDYQMLFDGPIVLGSNARLNGRVHSNGYRVSLFNQFNNPATTPNMITLDPSVDCGPATRFTTSRGSIGGPGRCTGGRKARADVGARVSLLRARDLTDRAHRLCARNGSSPGLNLICPPAAAVTTVRLAGQSVYVNGRRYGAGIAANRNSFRASQGAVVVVPGDVRLRGQLGTNARVLVIASAPPGSQLLGSGNATSVTIDQGGPTGAGPVDSSSFGIVADGDVVIDENAACGASFRGAVLSVTGALSMRTQWRMPMFVGGGRLCQRPLRVEASLSGHLPPTLIMAYDQTSTTFGFARRSYSYASALFDNPPPLFPTAGDWNTVSMSEANLDCFTRSGALDLENNRSECA